MARLPIYIYPDPVLKKKSEPVKEVSKEIKNLLDSMTETMYAAPGVGLSGPQVGVLKRVVVIDVVYGREEKTAKKLYQLVNPEILEREGEIEWEEGCLSIPGFFATMKRSKKVVAQALDRSGKKIIIEAEDLLAVCLQHEINHLDGKLIIDGASRLKRNMYLDKLKKQQIL